MTSKTSGTRSYGTWSHRECYPNQVPKTLGKFVAIDSGSSITTEQIVERIIKNRIEYETRNINKEKKELAVIQAAQKTAEKSG